MFVTQNQIVNHVNIFFSALWPAATRVSVDCAGVSELTNLLTIPLHKSAECTRRIYRAEQTRHGTVFGTYPRYTEL